jgi:hypothetical protein
MDGCFDRLSPKAKVEISGLFTEGSSGNFVAAR